MSKRRKSYFVLLFLFFTVFIFFIGIKVFFKPIIELSLKKAGFPEVKIEQATTGFSGTHLKEVALQKGLMIGDIALYASLSDLMQGRIGEIIVKDVRIGLPLELPERKQPRSPSNTSIGLFFKKLELENIVIEIPTPKGLLPLTLNANVINLADTYKITGNFSAQKDFAHLAGKLHGDITGDKISAQIEISEGDYEDKNLDVKRLSGWISTDYDLAKPSDFPLHAQIDIGALKIYGLPLQKTTLSISSTEEKIIASLSAQVKENGGNINTDAVLQAGKGVDSLVISGEITLADLDRLGLPNLGGNAKMNIKVEAQKTTESSFTSLQSWQNISAKVDTDVKDFSLDNLIQHARLKGSADLGFQMAEYPVIEGKVEFSEISLGKKHPYLIPVSASLSLHSLSSQKNTTGISGEIKEKSGLFYAKINGHHAFEKGSGQLSINIPPLTLVKDIHSLADISPASSKYIQDVSGTIGLNTGFVWRDGKVISSNGSLLLKDVSLRHGEHTIESVNAVVTADSLSPLVINKQEIAIGLLSVGLPLTNGTILFSFDPKGFLTQHAGEWQFAGGKLLLAPFTLQTENMAADVTLRAENLDLSELFKIAPLDGLSATGTVQGTIPLSIRKENINLKNGQLETTGPGLIKYNPQELPAFLRDNSQQQIVDLRNALTAFEYETLKMTLDGDLAADQKITLSLKGKNPLFYEGRPVNLNLNVEGPLQSVLKYNPGGSQIPDSIKKQIELYEKKNAK